MTDPLDLDALESVAMKATRGPWFIDLRYGREGYFLSETSGHLGITEFTRDTEHIATFDPPTVLAIFAALKEARSALADAWDEGCKFGYDYGRIEGRDDCAYAVPTANPYIDRSEAP